jgi:hypothetical protein
LKRAELLVQAESAIGRSAQLLPTAALSGSWGAVDHRATIAQEGVLKRDEGDFGTSTFAQNRSFGSLDSQERVEATKPGSHRACIANGRPRRSSKSLSATCGRLRSEPPAFGGKAQRTRGAAR